MSKSLMYRYRNQQEEPVIVAKREKSKLDVHKEINVVADSDAAARQKAARKWPDGTPLEGDENGLSASYALVNTYSLNQDW